MAIVRRKMPVDAKKKKKRSVDDDAAASDFTLPTERSTPSDRFADYTILLFGEKKIGKTDLTAQFDSTFHLMTEPGAKAQSIFQRPVNNWRDFMGYVKLLKKDKKFKTVSVDTADLLYKYAFDYTSQKMGFDHPSEEAYGKGWSAIRDTFVKGVLDLLATGKGVIFISHAIEKEVKMRGGVTYDRIGPTLAGQARDVLEGMVDLWFYYGYDGDARVLTIRGNDHIGAGHRLKQHFNYPDGTPITEIDMGHSAEQGYKHLVSAFNNQLPKPKNAKTDDEDQPKKKIVMKMKKRRL